MKNQITLFMIPLISMRASLKEKGSFFHGFLFDYKTKAFIPIPASLLVLDLCST